MAPGPPIMSPEPTLGVTETFPGDRLVVVCVAIFLVIVAITLAVCMYSHKCYLHKRCSKRRKDEEEHLNISSAEISAGMFHSIFGAAPLVGQWKKLKGLSSKELQKQRGRSRSSQSLASADLLSNPRVAIELSVQWDELARTCTMELMQVLQTDLPRKYRDTLMTLTTTIQTKESARKPYTKLHMTTTGYMARMNFPTHLDEKIVAQLPANVSKTILTFDVRQTSVLIAPLPLWQASLPLTPLLNSNAEMSVQLRNAPPEKRGEVVISVCYMPVAEKLSVSLLECQGLDAAVKEDLDETPEFYTKITLARFDQTLARKKTKKQAIKPIVMSTEAFTFDVPRAHADQIRIIVTVSFLSTIQGQLMEERLGKATYATDTHPSWDMVLKQTRKPQIMRQDIL